MKRIRWTPAEDAKMRKCYGILEPALIAKHLGRTKSQVTSRAWVLGLTKARFAK